MNIRKLYPQGKKKAFNVTYDDGVLQDIRFVELLNKYHLKGTFNLNSSLMATEFAWQHECGEMVKRLPREVVKKLYQGHEVASHTSSHPYMECLSKEEIIQELKEDKEQLSQLFECEICGFALPFSYYNEIIKECVKECGFTYGRISEESYSYAIPNDNFAWKAGIFHLSEQLLTFVQGFLESEEELALCQIVGHSYDLDFERRTNYDMWEVMECIFQKIFNDSTILPMTHLEIVCYIEAMKKAVITNSYIENASEVCLWFEVDGNVVEISPFLKYVFCK